MRLVYLFTSVLLAAASCFASVRDFYFHKDGDKFCVSKNGVGGPAFDASGASCKSSSLNDVRIRVIDAASNPSQKFGFDVERPFFILDGIYLDPNGRRTLSDLYDETNQFGMPSLLSSLGYTPILVQFAETVERSLPENAGYFTELLKFVNNNKLFGFANRTEDGFIVLGISQGGILGRYGSYKYDISRKSSDAPVRLYVSMDSPHQGAIMPKSLYYTINFWATDGGSSAAEAFSDMIEAPGASGLLVIKSEGESKKDYKEDFSKDRFLFGEYRKAAEYTGFPAVLISQGQLKGKSPAHSDTFFKLNRRAKAFGTVWGRAESKMFSTGKESEELSFNRAYEKYSRDDRREVHGTGKFDFVQGSTYPFAKTMYSSLRDGFLDAVRDGRKVNIMGYKKNISAAWDDDTLYQAMSTFIPTTSAIDLKCGGEISMKKDCAFSQSAGATSFEKPGGQSNAKAIYAVDPTHPRYNEPISGRHIELPKNGDKIDTTVLRGMQTDIWRVLCETAKLDYDAENKMFRNPNLAEYFKPNASCMDASNIPTIVKNAGLNVSKKFAYARYDYDKSASEKSKSVEFDLAAGWHKVALFDNGQSIPPGSSFEINVTVEKPKSDWMKAELLLSAGKGGANQLQLVEIPVVQDGKSHTVRWKMPFSGGVASKFRWFRLVLNSYGAHVKLSNPRLVQSGIEMENPPAIKSSVIFPHIDNAVNSWQPSTVVTIGGGTLNFNMRVDFEKHGSGLSIVFDKAQSMEQYKNLKVSYVPGTCQNTFVYFDSFKKGAKSLVTDKLENGYAVATIPIADIVDTQITPNFGLSASRLSMVGYKASEICLVDKVYLK